MLVDVFSFMRCFPTGWSEGQTSIRSGSSAEWISGSQ